METKESEVKLAFRKNKLEERRQLSQLMIDNNPGCVPVVIEKDPRSKLAFNDLKFDK